VVPTLEDKTTFESILKEVKEQIAWITVNRQQVLNALNHKTIDELGDAFDRAAKDDAVRALILTGAGEKSFVAGVTSTNSRDRFPKKR